MGRMETVTVTLRLPKEVREEARLQAFLHRMSLANFYREAIVAHIEREELPKKKRIVFK